MPECGKPNGVIFKKCISTPIANHHGGTTELSGWQERGSTATLFELRSGLTMRLWQITQHLSISNLSEIGSSHPRGPLDVDM